LIAENNFSAGRIKVLKKGWALLKRAVWERRCLEVERNWVRWIAVKVRRRLRLSGVGRGALVLAKAWATLSDGDKRCKLVEGHRDVFEEFDSDADLLSTVESFDSGVSEVFNAALVVERVILLDGDGALVDWDLGWPWEMSMGMQHKVESQGCGIDCEKIEVKEGNDTEKR
jgi:hypothetical protein